MSRTSPNILNSFTQGYLKSEILEADCLYAVCFDDKPIGMRVSSLITDVPFKYRRTSFTNPGHARRLAAKLNKAMHSTRFAVMRFRGELLEPESK